MHYALTLASGYAKGKKKKKKGRGHMATPS